MKRYLFILICLILSKFAPSQGFYSVPILDGQPNKITKTIQGITFDSNYDNGSLEDVTEAGTDAFECKLYTEYGEIGPRKYWFRFKMTGVAGRNIKLHINHRYNPYPVISLDGKNWRRLNEEEAPDSSEIVLHFFPWENNAELAFFFPLGLEETRRRVNEYVRRCDAATSQVMLGFLDLVTSNSREAKILRKYCIFNIVPLINVDGVYMGLTRWDSQGIDPEHIWGDPGKTPETFLIKKQVDEFMSSANPIQVSLNLHSTVSNSRDTFFFKHIAPSVTEEFELIQQRYIDALDNATILFENQSPQTSQLHPFNYLESYYWSKWGKDVMAMTHEGHFYKRLPDGAWITDQDYLELGRAMAVALLEYFKLYYKEQ
jgi:hypothetical protein